MAAGSARAAAEELVMKGRVQDTGRAIRQARGTGHPERGRGDTELRFAFIARSRNFRARR